MTSQSTPLFAANWKMHKGPGATREFVARFANLHEPRPDRRTVFFPPAVSIEAFRVAAGDRIDLEIGIQDVHPERAGAHTGAVSAEMARDAGAGWALAGHSERRREFGDDDAIVTAKAKRILESGLRAVVCVGETLRERDEGQLASVLSRQIRAVLDGIGAANRGELTWAYEPVWAIGTGRTASPDDAAEAHAIVRDAVSGGAGPDVAEQAVILYGGSVKPANIEQLMNAPGVNGVLVGGASLEPADFAAICGWDA